jgi:ABC-2 type transport system ATP-binding protein
MANSIVASRLRVRRGGNVVLPGIDFAVASGQVTGLLGPSGCGKTTLMRCVVGVQKIEAGEVFVLDEAAGSAGLRRRVGYVTQAPSVYRDLSVEENLWYFARVLGVGRERIDRVTEEVGLGGVADRVVGEVSGGQRSRVSLATALLGEPDLLVLDEPTVGLDPVLRRDLWRLFHQLAKSGKTLLISSHVMDEAIECKELLLMREGELLATGSPRELMERTGADDVGEAFLRLVEEGA